MNFLQTAQAPPSLSTASFLAFSQPLPRYVVGPPIQDVDFSARNAPDIVKHSREQNLGAPFWRTIQGFTKNDLPQCSQACSLPFFQFGFLLPLTSSLVNAFAGFSPFLKLFPTKLGPRITRFAMCQAPPHDLLQNVCGLPLSLFVKVCPHCLQSLVMVFIWGFHGFEY
jgi:hypothetical protein